MFYQAYLCYSRDYGIDSLQCQEIAFNLAVCCREQGKNDAAKSHYERAKKVLTMHYGKNHPKVQAVDQHLAELASDPYGWVPMPGPPPFMTIEPRKAHEKKFAQ